MIDLNCLDKNGNYTVFLIENTQEEIINLIKEQITKINKANTNITTNKSNIKHYGDIKVFLDESKVFVKDKEIRLPLKEFKLLEAFVKYPNKLWTRNALLDEVWGIDFYGDAKTVDVHISWLRRNLNLHATKSKYLITVRGLGYRFI